MTRIAYVNGRYLPYHQAAVHVEDRGFQFADGVYEVCEVKDGRLIDESRHMARLDRSLGELRIDRPMGNAALGAVLREVVRRNRVRNGVVYLQITRGTAPRNFLIPAEPPPPTIVVIARPINPVPVAARAVSGVAIATTPDNRWERVDIKTTALLPNILAKEAAKKAGAYEAWFVDRDGLVTEGASTNAWIVTEAGVLVTRPAERGILRGITRSVVLDLARREGLTVEERPFSVAEAKAAREAFLTAASATVLPIVMVDGHPIGDGRPGPVAAELRRIFHSQAEVGSFWSTGKNG
jgi:D-alanine transaminase